jgi:hypothetical protein
MTKLNMTVESNDAGASKISVQCGEGINREFVLAPGESATFKVQRGRIVFMKHEAALADFGAGTVLSGILGNFQS